MNVNVKDLITGAEILFEIPITTSYSIKITQTVLSSFIVTVFLCTLFIILGRKITKRPGKLQVLTEKGVSMLYDLVSDTMGSHNMKFAPYIGALMLSSLFGSLISTTGFFRASTADLSTTATWAVMTTVLVWIGNIKENGFLGWLKGFTEPVFVMTPMNILSEVASPVSMAFRHFGNVIGGSILTTLLYYVLALASSFILGWIPNAIISSIPILQVGIPAVFSLYFDFFSSAIQAFVFSILSMVYIGAANPDHSQDGNT